MIGAVYSQAMRLAQPFVRRKLRRRANAEPGYGVAVEERFGTYTSPAANPRAGIAFIWVHAVSLGETRAAAILIARLRQQIPGMRLLLTHGTATGREEGARLLQEGDVQVWQPWDTPAAVGKFLDHFKPRIGILMETEVWPNMVAICQRRKVPLVLANARLSDKSLRQALKLAWLARPAYGGLTAVWAQTADDARRLGQLGAQVTGVFGNLKFDALPNQAQLAQGRAVRLVLQRPVIVFASSREGEEVQLLTILKENKPAGAKNHAQEAPEKIATNFWTDVQWLIVPRHPQRFEEVAGLINQHGFEVQRRSQWAGNVPVPRGIWLGDSLGEMSLYYGLADVALLGGSFEPLGGQNLIEAAACACPVVMGPHTFNFTEAAQLAEAAGAAFRAPDLAGACAQALQLATCAVPLQNARYAAVEFTQAHQGATDKLVQAIHNVLNQASQETR